MNLNGVCLNECNHLNNIVSKRCGPVHLTDLNFKNQICCDLPQTDRQTDRAREETDHYVLNRYEFEKLMPNTANTDGVTLINHES